MNNLGRNVAIWLVIIVAGMAVLSAFQPTGSSRASQQLAYSDFIHDVDDHQVRSVLIQEQNISGTLTNGTSFETYAPLDPGLASRLTAAGVEVTAKPLESGESPILRYIGMYLPVLLAVGLCVMVFRQMQGVEVGPWGSENLVPNS